MEGVFAIFLTFVYTSKGPFDGDCIRGTHSKGAKFKFEPLRGTRQGHGGGMGMHGNAAVGNLHGPMAAGSLPQQLGYLLETAQRLLAESTGVSGYSQDYGKIAAAPQPAVYTLMAMQVCKNKLNQGVL